MADMTPDQREKLQERIKSLDAQADNIRAAMKPFEDRVKPFQEALYAIEAVKEGLVEDAGVEVVGNCESCELILFAGDLGHRCADGPILCAACSPTWKDLLDQYTAEGAAGSAEDPEAFALGLARARVGAGNADKPFVWSL